ncbi:hypothetical protein XENORESO_009120 [Xenotaenia resolanae]|uniref:Uncharacterized protein n=1 Tax=Xenotaenia resolanae TaxID=208358 RepID=A0ABV0W246_9TELE
MLNFKQRAGNSIHIRRVNPHCVSHTVYALHAGRCIFPIKSTPGSVLLCSFCVSALFSQTPSMLWQMAAHTEPGSGSAGGFFLLKGSFLLHCYYMYAQYEVLLQSQYKRLSTVSTCSSRRSESH